MMLSIYTCRVVLRNGREVLVKDLATYFITTVIVDCISRQLVNAPVQTLSILNSNSIIGTVMCRTCQSVVNYR